MQMYTPRSFKIMKIVHTSKGSCRDKTNAGNENRLICVTCKGLKSTSIDILTDVYSPNFNPAENCLNKLETLLNRDSYIALLHENLASCDWLLFLLIAFCDQIFFSRLSITEVEVDAMLDSLQNAKTNTSTCDYLKQRLQLRHGRDVLVTETCNIPVKAQSFHSLEWKDCGQSQVVTERQFETCHQSYNRRKVTMTSEMDRTKSRPARWKKAERDDVKTNPTQNTWQVENWKTVFFAMMHISVPILLSTCFLWFGLIWFQLYHWASKYHQGHAASYASIRIQRILGDSPFLFMYE